VSSHPRALPLVGVLACQKHRENGSTYSRVNDVLTEQLTRYGPVAAVVIAAVRPDLAGGVLQRLDGLVLPGSGSFVHPHWYAPHVDPIPGREYDGARDNAADELLRQAEGIPDLPVLASCRGMQELAVHHGGRLDAITPTSVQHRLRVGEHVPDRWMPAHSVEVRPGGILAELTDPTYPAVEVNSQHSDRVAEVPHDVRIEAVAPDGVIEAISVGWPHRFVLGIQWHFEQRTDATPLNHRLLTAFGQRCRDRMERRPVQ